MPPVSFARLGIWLMLLCGAGACAAHGVVHVAPDESRPHFNWEIEAGGVDDDREAVCSSAQPAPTCSLRASTDVRPSFVTIRLYVHGAAQPTSYLGFMRAPFVEGSEGRNVGEVNASVEPGSRPVGTTVIGRVTSTPGSYTLLISVDATQPGATTPEHLSQEVPVIVKPGETPR